MTAKVRCSWCNQEVAFEAEALKPLAGPEGSRNDHAAERAEGYYLLCPHCGAAIIVRQPPTP